MPVFESTSRDIYEGSPSDSANSPVVANRHRIADVRETNTFATYLNLAMETINVIRDTLEAIVPAVLGPSGPAVAAPGH
jgi:hypothetical protein